MMHYPRFIAKRLGGHQLADGSFSFSALVASIGTLSISVAVALILLAFAVLIGFKENIKNKVFSLAGHIKVQKESSNQSFEERPLPTRSHLADSWREIPEISHFQYYTQKAGVIKAKQDVQGILLKGIDSSFLFDDFKENMKEGRWLNLKSKDFTREMVLSSHIANKLSLKLNDSVVVFFVQDPPLFRKLAIVGIYETGMEAFDEKLVFTDLKMLQKLNKWGDTLVSGYEITVKDFSKIEETSQKIVPYTTFEMKQQLVTEKHFDIFDWLILLDNNVVIFLVIILTVACFNIASVLMIMIMERTQMIGILKALGASNQQIRAIFWQRGIAMTLKGLFWGNVVGLCVCGLQYFLKIIPLDPKNYYMNTIPIAWDWLSFGLVNVGITCLIIGVLVIPTAIINRIDPVKSIKFD